MELDNISDSSEVFILSVCVENVECPHIVDLYACASYYLNKDYFK